MSTASPGRAEGTVVELAQELLRIDTSNPPGREVAAAECVAELLEEVGLEVTVQRFDDERANVVARVRGAGERGSLVLSGHLDTVPVGPGDWSYPPHAGTVVDGTLYGRGSVDMKGSVAAMTIAVRELSRSGRTPAGDLVLALTAGEETDSCGARLLAESGQVDDADLFVVGEPTGFDVGFTHRGALWVDITTHGTRRHGSRPAWDDNALCQLLEALHPLGNLEALIAGREDPILGGASLSLNQIHGGDAPNVQPDEATAGLDFRTVPGQDHAALLEQLRGQLPGTTVSVVRDSPPLPAADKALAEDVAGAVETVIGRRPAIRGLGYLTDASVLVSELSAPALIVGPGSEDQAHGVNESVEVRALADAVEVYEEIAERRLYVST